MHSNTRQQNCLPTCTQQFGHSSVANVWTITPNPPLINHYAVCLDCIFISCKSIEFQASYDHLSEDTPLLGMPPHYNQIFSSLSIKQMGWASKEFTMHGFSGDLLCILHSQRKFEASSWLAHGDLTISLMRYVVRAPPPTPPGVINDTNGAL